MRRRPRQQSFLWKKNGGRREGAGRKRAAANVGLLPHAARPEFVPRIPVHATMRATRGIPSMRAESVARVVFEELRRVSTKGFRVLHFSVQADHLHLVVEGDDAECFSRGMQRLAARIARRVNMLVSRRGTFWRERYHRRDLGTPRQFRNALVYVTMNYRKHARSEAERGRRARKVDGLSSGLWLDGWKDDRLIEELRRVRAAAGDPPPPVASPATWISRVGWKRLGRIDVRESPRSPG